jgi:hypothetical protein
MRKKLFISLLSVAFLLVSGCNAASAPENTATLPPTASALPPTNTTLPPTETPQATDTLIPPTETTVPMAEATEPSPTSGPFELTIPAFGMEEPIPVQYTCHGVDISPPLAWSDPPTGTQSLALIMDDPDAVQVVGFVWDHWLLFNIPADIRSLPEGIPADKELPNGSRHGTNTFPRLGYDGPCPPSGQTHKYIFTIYALDTLLDLEAGANKETLLAAMEGHILAEATYSGVYTSP